MQVYKDGLGVRQFSSFFTPINQKWLLSRKRFFNSFPTWDTQTMN